MKWITSAALAASLLLTCAEASATASATLTMDGLTGIGGGGGTTGYWEAFYISAPGAVGPGQSVTQTFDYTVAFHDDGLPVTRSWAGCEPVTIAYCGPAPTGFEQAVLHISGGSVRYTNPFVTFTFSPTVLLSATVGEDTTYTGTFSMTETNTDPLVARGEPAGIVVSLWVDSSPLPEPASLGMMATGAFMLMGAYRRRQNARGQGQ